MPDAKAAPKPPRFETAVVKTYAPVDGAALTLRDVSSTVKTLVRSDRAQFGVAFGRSARVADALVCGSRPGEWLILGSPAAVEAAEALVDRDGFTNVIGFTHGRSLFRVSGAPVTALLEKVCSLDWSDTITPDGAVVSASVALVTCDIIRSDTEGEPSYLLVCDRSYGQYLFDSLIDAGGEFGITAVIGRLR